MMSCYRLEVRNMGTVGLPDEISHAGLGSQVARKIVQYKLPILLLARRKNDDIICLQSRQTQHRRE